MAVARAEVHEALADGRLRWGAGTAVLLLVATCVFGARHYVELHREREAGLHETTKQFLSQSPKNPHAGAHTGVDAFRPEPVLSFFDRGVDDHVGIDIFMEPHHPNYFTDVPILDSIGTARMGRLSGAEVALFLLPLLALMLAAPAITRERERGTLRLLLAQGVSPAEVMAGKLAGLGAVLGAALLLPAVVLAIVLLGLALSDPSSVDVTRVAMIIVAYGAYTLAFLLVSLAISAVAGGTRQALLVALGVWAFVVLVAPRVVDEFIRARVPTPSAIMFKEEIRADPAEPMDLLGLVSQIDRFQSDALKKYGVSKVEDLPMNIAGLCLEDAEVRNNRVFDRHYNALFHRFREQQRETALASVLSPASAVSLLSSSAAGTDIEHRLDWWRSAETQRRRINTILNNYFATHSTSKQGYEFIVGRDVWELVPPWRYQNRPGTWALARSWPALASLGACVLMALLAFAAATRAMRVLA